MFGLSLTSVSGPVGYGLLFALVFGESAGLPVPGESSIMVASIAASQGSLSIVAVLLVAMAAAILGDNLGYVCGRAFGRRIWTAGKIGRRKRQEWLDDVDDFLDDHGSIAVIVARWLPVARFVVPWLAGMNRMPWRTFFVCNAAGGIGWVLTVGMAAYVIGSTAKNAIVALGLVGLVGVVIGLAGHAAWHRRKHRRQQDGHPAHRSTA
ncbi:MAG TPA: DedA family protein [Gaiellales bacterium]|nr:DedA family protein [Gaiellales bacterium]